MGWADCGKDSKGHPIGYAFEATCDYPRCQAKIDRGLAYACGNMHGYTEYGCGGYFCDKHMAITDREHDSQLCPRCLAVLNEAEPDWME